MLQIEKSQYEIIVFLNFNKQIRNNRGCCLQNSCVLLCRT
ncbi:hypothetical protein SELSPUOL_00054 [Selenomonas sputigena ATCC 35185]|uniref:Uncharacterized protein n=1 Tax=Selenomonas sputigena (strain ATCC 35185 / DSM 20758 / CCUG 44933 / VPI D19B-28) TaxID=546271 RepID=C9LRI8_SELS3|nr:hypothetical protein SELSPUOL_00054 [Selenomonas sputigena ATCC 35185]